MEALRRRSSLVVGPVVGGEHVGHGDELVSCHGEGRIGGCREACVGCETNSGKVGTGHRGVGCQNPSFYQVPGEQVEQVHLVGTYDGLGQVEVADSHGQSGGHGYPPALRVVLQQLWMLGWASLMDWVAVGMSQ